MKHQLVLFGLLITFLFPMAIYGQQSAQSAFKKEISTIDSLFNIEKYEEGGKVARKLLLTIPASDYGNVSLCNYLIGGGFRFTAKYDSALYYYTIAFDNAKRANDSNRIVRAGAGLLFMCNHTLKNEASRREVFNELTIVYKKKLSLKLKTILLDAFADYYDVSGQVDLYFETLIESVKLRQENFRLDPKAVTPFDSTNLGISYMNIGEAYLDINQPEKANQYLQQARQWINNYTEGLAQFYKNEMNVYLHTKDEKTAIKYNDSILKLANRSGQDLGIAMISSNLMMSKYYLDKNDIMKASYYYHEAKKHVNINSNKIMLGLLNWTAACILVEQKKFREALAYLKPIEQEAKDWQMVRYAKFLMTYADCFSNIGQHAKANKFYRQYILLGDSIVRQNYRRNTLEAEAKYQDEAKKIKIAQQQKNIALAHKNNTILFIAFCMVSVMSILLFRLYRNKKNLSDLLQDSRDKLAVLNGQLNDSNRTKSKLFGIISHDLRSPISQVHQLLDLQHSETFNEISEEERKKLESETRMATIYLLDAMDDLLIWSKTQMQAIHPTIINVDIHEVYEQCLFLLQRQMQNKQIRISEAIPTHCRVQTDRHFLSTILRNLLHNAIKASENGGLITVSCKLFEGTDIAQSIIITNQGTAFDQHNYLNALEDGETSHLLIGGLGLKVVAELCRKAGIEITFSNEHQHQTACRLKFPGLPPSSSSTT